jgi:hypothetical protein
VAGGALGHSAVGETLWQDDWTGQCGREQFTVHWVFVMRACSALRLVTVVLRRCLGDCARVACVALRDDLRIDCARMACVTLRDAVGGARRHVAVCQQLCCHSGMHRTEGRSSRTEGRGGRDNRTEGLGGWLDMWRAEARCSWPIASAGCLAGCPDGMRCTEGRGALVGCLACCHSGMRRTEGRGSCTAGRGGRGSRIESDHGGLEQSTVSDVALGLPRYFVNGSTGCTALDLCGVPWGLIVLRFCDGRKVTFAVEEVDELQLIVVHVRLVVGSTCRGRDSFIC